MMRIYLTGFMGAGKTMVGRALAQKLGCEFVDLDYEIEHSFGQTIESIFETGGESEFRKRFGFDLRIGGIINRQIASWTDQKWDAQVHFLRSVPPELLFNALQSHFSVSELGSWLLSHPRHWPRLARCTLKIFHGLLMSH